MRQPGSYRLTTSALAALAAAAAGGGGVRADMAVELVKAAPAPTVPHFNAPVPTPAVSARPASPLVGEGLGPGQGADDATAMAASAPSPSTSAVGVWIINAMLNGGSVAPGPFATGSASTAMGPSPDSGSDPGRFTAVADVSTDAAGDLLAPAFDPGTVGPVAGAEVPLSAPEPSTLLVVLAAVPFAWFYVRGRTAREG